MFITHSDSFPLLLLCICVRVMYVCVCVCVFAWMHVCVCVMFRQQPFNQRFNTPLLHFPSILSDAAPDACPAWLGLIIDSNGLVPHSLLVS